MYQDIINTLYRLGNNLVVFGCRYCQIGLKFSKTGCFELKRGIDTGVQGHEGSPELVTAPESRGEDDEQGEQLQTACQH
jgi:hypothetical protein